VILVTEPDQPQEAITVFGHIGPELSVGLFLFRLTNSK
jgi:hypothetical protein